MADNVIALFCFKIRSVADTVLLPHKELWANLF